MQVTQDEAGDTAHSPVALEGAGNVSRDRGKSTSGDSAPIDPIQDEVDGAVQAHAGKPGVDSAMLVAAMSIQAGNDQHHGGSSATASTPQDHVARIAALQQAGAGKFDGARLYYLEVLLRRAVAQQGGARALLFEKLTTALDDFSSRFTAAQQRAAASLAAIVKEGQPAEDIKRLYDSGDFHALHQALADQSRQSSKMSLSALVHELEQHGHGPATTNTRTGVKVPASIQRSGATTVAAGELRTLRKFRSTWSRLSTDKRIAQALDQAPKNAGPANPHILILRSLELMQEISPDYLTRFITYADTLLSLEASEREKAAPPKKTRAGKTSTKKTA